MITKRKLTALLGGTAMILSGCLPSSEYFEGYNISRHYYKAREVYTLKRPDNFTCTIDQGGFEVKISENYTSSFSLISSAYAGSVSIVPVIAAATAVIASNSARIARENRRKQEERVNALIGEDLLKISSECSGVLQRYLAFKAKQ